MEVVKLKKTLIIIIVSITLLSLLCYSGIAAEYKWKIQHGRPMGSAIDNDINWMVEEIKERSNDRIEIEVFPASQLGDYTVVQERVGLGDVEMQLVPLATTVDQRLSIHTFPYLVEKWEDVPKLYSTGSTLMNILSELMEKQNIKLISSWPSYFGGIGLVKSPPSPGDPDVPKNIKIRVPPTKSYELTAQSLGYLATPLAWTETFTSMQTGIVDGVIGSGAEGILSNYKDLVKYYLAINDHFETWYFYMNLDLWNSLSEEDRQIIQDVGLELEQARFERAEAEEKANMQLLEESGIEVITFTDDELSTFARKVRSEVWPQIERDVTPEILEQILKSIE
jgi:TRAP-type C4-dicarboxylate transport system substrate-binding protein